jgi:hypothetical protein
MIGVWRGAGLLLAVAAAAGTGWLSEAPYPGATADQAMIRLVFGVRAEQLEQCRRVSAEELAKLPPHMRQAVICEGQSAHYRLQVRVDEASVFNAELTGGGIRHDRPIHALREIAVAPGRRHLRVEWRRIEPADSAAESAPSDSLSGRDRRDSETRARRRLEAAPAEMLLDETVLVGPRQVVLVTYQPEGRKLALRHE